MKSSPAAEARLSAGQKTRQAILDHSVDLASVEGLEGLTIGRLAEELGMSKSGLFAHFGSKEELQLAAIEAARERFVSEVFQPALSAPRGVPRLLAICDSWLAYIRRGVFPGGCFFAAASFEFDSRPGSVRDAIVDAMNVWIKSLEKAVRLGRDEGHFNSEVEPAQLAFEINAILFGANFDWQLRGETRALARAHTAINQRINSLTTAKYRRAALKRA